MEPTTPSPSPEQPPPPAVTPPRMLRLHPPATQDGFDEEPIGEPQTLGEKVMAALRRVYDPEIPLNIYELGLIYKVDLNEDTGRAFVLMTLTTPNCPEAQYLPGKVRSEIEAVEGVSEADVQITFDPPWSKDLMSDAAKLQLGLI